MDVDVDIPHRYSTRESHPNRLYLLLLRFLQSICSTPHQNRLPTNQSSRLPNYSKCQRTASPHLTWGHTLKPTQFCWPPSYSNGFHVTIIFSHFRMTGNVLLIADQKPPGTVGLNLKSTVEPTSYVGLEIIDYKLVKRQERIISRNLEPQLTWQRG